MSRMNFAGYVAHMTIFSWKSTIACRLVFQMFRVRLGLTLRLGLDLLSGWLVVMHTYET